MDLDIDDLLGKSSSNELKFSSWYDFKDMAEDTYDAGKDEDGNFQISDKLFKKFSEKNMQVIEKVEQIGLPKPGEQLRLITMNPFNTVSIISYIANLEVIKHAVFVIFAINQHAAKTIINLIKSNRIEKVDMIVSSIRNAGHVSKSKAVDMLKEYVDVIYVNSHAKITILKTAKNHYCIEGSGNMSFNGRIEQYIIDNDIKLYEFSKVWMKELMEYRMKE